MKLYFAPLEGITTYIFRNAHAEIFGGADAYFAPFITPSDNEKISIKNLKDILPERNSALNLKVQVLTNRADSFLKFEEKIKELGYTEVNINIGCPSGTVVKKGRGAGFLRDIEGMDRFLYEIFEKSKMKISVKTRIGYTSGLEMEKLISVYNKYPLDVLIIHPRVRESFYNGEPDMAVFSNAYNVSQNKVCYNGDVSSAEDFNKIASKYAALDSVMIGRGAVCNPAIFREIRGGEKLKSDELVAFSQCLITNYNAVLKSDTFTLHKLKEIWMYAVGNFPQEKKLIKSIKKSNNLSDFMRAVTMLSKSDITKS